MEQEKGATLVWELTPSAARTRLTAYLMNAGPATAGSLDESMDEIYAALKNHLEARAGSCH